MGLGPKLATSCRSDSSIKTAKAGVRCGSDDYLGVAPAGPSVFPDRISVLPHLEDNYMPMIALAIEARCYAWMIAAAFTGRLVGSSGATVLRVSVSRSPRSFWLVEQKN